MTKEHFKIRLLPVVAFTAVTLLLLRAYSYTMDIGNWTDIPIDSSSKLGDVFCNVKSEACLYISIWAFLTLAFLVITGQITIKRTKLYIPMAIYSLFVLLSFIMSDYRVMAWYGGINRFEGSRTILCYIFMLFYTINVVDSNRDALIVILPTLVSVLIACLIGITQLLGHDILVSQLANIVIGNGMELSAEFWPGQVYQTVYNMNYVGMYLAIFIPMLIFVIFKGVKNYRHYSPITCRISRKRILFITVVAGFLLLLIALNVYGADSVGGVIGIGAGIVLMLVMLAKRRSVRIIISTLSMLSFIAVLSFMYFTGKDTIKCIDYFVTGKDEIITSIDGNELTIKYDKETKEYTLTDSEGNLLSTSIYKNKEGNFQIDDSRFKGKFVLIPMEYYGEAILYFDAFNEEFFFRMDGDEILYINPYKKDIKLDKVESVGFKGHLSSGSGRGYIWSRTIPLLKDHLLVGSGADTFIFEFPQHDYAGKYSAEYFLNSMLDKPHNMYLMMIVCTGGISFIAFMVMMIMFFRLAGRAAQENMIVLTVAAGIFGFLVAGLFNDSTVCIMPIFYGMMGVGTALSEIYISK